MTDITDIKDKIIDPVELYERMRLLAEFARGFLHLSFPELEKINPSFTLISKYCKYVAEVLEEEAKSTDKKDDADFLAEEMNDIADAIVDRDDSSIIDSMSILDDFMERRRL